MLDDPEIRAALFAALEWQVELGADEAIAESPIDRTELPAPTAAKSAGAAAGPSTPKARAKPAARPVQVEPDPVGDARKAAQAADSIEALRAALEAFDGSSLKRGANKTVFADGNPQARVMVVGEAPGRDEDRVGLPFVGRSGQLLDRMLEAIGLSRKSEDPAKSAYITIVIPYRPLQNRTPDDREVAMMIPFIERHIALAKPAVVLCAGNIPAKHLMAAPTGITKFRGQWRDFTQNGVTIPMLASFHPAYLLRSPEQKRLAWRDLLTLAERLESLE